MGDLLREICARLHRQEELRTDALGEVDAKDWGTIKKKLTGLGTAGVFNVNYFFRSTTIKITDWLPL